MTRSRRLKHPFAGEPQPQGDHEAWKKWAKDNRHAMHEFQDMLHKQGHERHKDIQKIEQGKDPKCLKKRRGSHCVVS